MNAHVTPSNALANLIVPGLAPTADMPRSGGSRRIGGRPGPRVFAAASIAA